MIMRAGENNWASEKPPETIKAVDLGCLTESAVQLIRCDQQIDYTVLGYQSIWVDWVKP